MTDYFDLGNHSHPITTQSQAAQTWFDRGLIWCYGFNHEEAVRCFQQVIEYDPECAMGYWGLAYASTSFYNKPWGWFDDDERSHECGRDGQHVVAQPPAPRGNENEQCEPQCE